MKKLLFLALLTAACAGFTACEDDEERLDETLAGRVWAGDLGFYDDRFPLDSYIYLGADGFGTDELYYVDNGAFLDRFNLRWWVDYDDTLCLDYGNLAPPRRLLDVRIRSGMLTGELYIDGIYYDRVTLHMQ